MGKFSNKYQAIKDRHRDVLLLGIQLVVAGMLVYFLAPVVFSAIQLLGVFLSYIITIGLVIALFIFVIEKGSDKSPFKWMH